MKTCKQKALEWGISERTVNDLCKKGRIPGAVKNGGRWKDLRQMLSGRLIKNAMMQN